MEKKPSENVFRETIKLVENEPTTTLYTFCAEKSKFTSTTANKFPNFSGDIEIFGKFIQNDIDELFDFYDFKIIINEKFIERITGVEYATYLRELGTNFYYVPYPLHTENTNKLSEILNSCGVQYASLREKVGAIAAFKIVINGEEFTIVSQSIFNFLYRKKIYHKSLDSIIEFFNNPNTKAFCDMLNTHGYYELRESTESTEFNELFRDLYSNRIDGDNYFGTYLMQNRIYYSYDMNDSNSKLMLEVGVQLHKLDRINTIKFKKELEKVIKNLTLGKNEFIDNKFIYIFKNDVDVNVVNIVKDNIDSFAKIATNINLAFTKKEMTLTIL